jgi:ribonuclease HII
MASLVCGIDEAGRGPLAGPVTSSAVILPENFPRHLLRDSKSMNPEQRAEAAVIIRRNAVDYGIGWCWPEEIDRLNIHRATLLSMKRAVCALRLTPDVVFVDGLFTPCLGADCIDCRAVVKGDQSVPEIQAASIIAKTTRDLWMQRYARIEPDYGFERHKGYATEEHRRLLTSVILSPIHRRSFHIDTGFSGL